MYTCPVCGYDKLKKPPEEHLICVCCGTQFDLDDEGPLAKPVMHAMLRRAWVESGAHWYSRVVPPSAAWNPWRQMFVAGFYDARWLGSIEVTESGTTSTGGFIRRIEASGELVPA
jgi:hypothetical protein